MILNKLLPWLTIAALALPPAARAMSVEVTQEGSTTAGVGRLVYDAVEQRNQSAAAAHLRNAIESLGGRCPAVERYQMFSATADSRTLKVACVGRPLYAISVDAHGHMLLNGGDGHVRPMAPADGTILTPDVDSDNDASPAAALLDRWRLPSWAALALAPISLLLGLSYLLIRRKRERESPEYSRWRGLNSADKDELLTQSDEVYPNIYAHPSGLYIARGRRGKRRLFRTLLLAYLYRSLGLKLGQIR